MSAATAEGHLDCVRKNRQSAKREERVTAKEAEADFQPPPLNADEDADCSCTFTFEATGKTCSDQSGKFPVTTADRNTQLFVLCHCNGNCMFLEPMKSKTKEQILEAF